MSSPAVNLFGTSRLSVAEAQDLTAASLLAYGERHRHWCIAWSGGKDSTATMTLVLYLVASGQVPAPESITVLYADTRMELPPLAAGAQATLARVREIAASGTFPCELRAEVVMADLDKRLLVYTLGRGVPPPNNNTLRWCTRQIKIEPMKAAVERHFLGLNPACAGPDGAALPVGEWPAGVVRPLTITGVRVGESAIRDGRIATNCTKNGAECGQGWYQETLPGDLTATLAPLLHWRVCTVWDWLALFAPMAEFGGWNTRLLAEAYGGEQAEEVNARTGCVGCALAQEDTALDAVIRLFPDQWGHLAPLKRLRPLWREVRLPQHRHRKLEERRQDGSLSKSPNRMGPLTMEARAMALDVVLGIQAEVNALAIERGRPTIDILNPEEEARIRWHWEAGIYPERWSEGDPLASAPYEQVFADGTRQPLLFSLDVLGQ